MNKRTQGRDVPKGAFPGADLPGSASQLSSTSDLTPAQLALVHVAKARLGLDDTEYRDLLEAAAGVRSARDLNQARFQALIQRLEGLGFRAIPKRPRPGMASPAQVVYIRALWARWRGEREDPEERGLLRWLSRRFGISSLKHLDSTMSHQTLVALKAMVARREQRPSPLPQERGKVTATTTALGKQGFPRPHR